jgi:hypothetical protein
MENKSSANTAIIVAIITVIGGIIVAVINNKGKSPDDDAKLVSTPQSSTTKYVDKVDAFINTIENPREWVTNFDSVLSNSSEKFNSIIGQMITVKLSNDKKSTFVYYSSKLGFPKWSEKIVQLRGQNEKLLYSTFQLEYPNIDDLAKAEAIFDGARKFVSEKSTHQYEEIENLEKDETTIKSYSFRPRALVGALTGRSYRIELVKRNNFYQVQITIHPSFIG